MHATKSILPHSQAENLRTETTNFNTLNFNTLISKDIFACFMRHEKITKIEYRLSYTPHGKAQTLSLRNKSLI